MSRALRVLEDTSGPRLFVRGTAGIRLTKPGQRLFELADQIRSGLARFRAGARGQLHPSMHISLGMF